MIALIVDDQPCLVDETVNHPEEPILLLAHSDRHLLLKAVAAVAIGVRAVARRCFTIEENEWHAQLFGARITPFKTYRMEKGDVDAVWKKADHARGGSEYRV